ncbi:hypothetical protein M011DRAFT_483954 [Sporormia fimetaria CBS 119925]|uniref:Spindle pole body-associated protein cut12 domain-containing protein n=1 Tax=Sporormia fimetaria CBS 119925 TaxID=1340428 RepID=A0A6A6VLQ1_9PLEO|nr:hypothetical protein M011DRAFT_483954 [Sporormia fimetaria CBS 119925]
MFTWLTGPRVSNVVNDVGLDDTTFLEPPDTPAPQFAVKALKQAIFGTPAPQEQNSAKALDMKPKTNERNPTAPVLPPPREASVPTSPSKLPNGILMTPGTASRGRKSVSFGAHVVDNEGKRGGFTRSGIPSDCPGKFPSPWTPGTQLNAETQNDSKARTKLTEALYNARAADTPRSTQKPKAKDDSDITLDLSAPRSESGKYWKQQYESYAEKSQKEAKKLLAKQQLAKNYAKKKDAEAIEAINRLEDERKRFRSRERQLEQQNKTMQEQLDRALAENSAASAEMAKLKSRLADLEKSIPQRLQQNTTPFEIYEDKSARRALSERLISAEGLVEGASDVAENKENSPPKVRQERRRTLTRTPSRSRPETQTREPTLQNAEAPDGTPRAFKSAHNMRPTKPSVDTQPPQSPVVLPSSPLPVPSPDPWMADLNDSPAVPAMDRMALPISSGLGYSRPAATKPTANRHRRTATAPGGGSSKPRTTDAVSTNWESNTITKETKQAEAKKAEITKPSLATTSQPSHASANTQSKSSMPLDRKEEARRRLQERKERKQKELAASRLSVD